MISNEGLYTTLTLSQLLIGLIIGLASVFLISVTERRRHKRPHESARANTYAANKPAALPPIVLGIMRAAYYTLGVLAASRKPIFLGSLVSRVHAAQLERRDKELLTPVAIRAAVDRLVSYGNARLERRGLSITDSGVELFKRLARITELPTPKPGSHIGASPSRAPDAMARFDLPRSGAMGSRSPASAILRSAVEMESWDTRLFGWRL